MGTAEMMSKSGFRAVVRSFRPMEPVVDRDDADVAQHAVTTLTGNGAVADPVVQAYCDFQAEMVRVWDEENSHEAAATVGRRFRKG